MMKCADAIAKLIEGRANYAVNNDEQGCDVNHYLWVSRGYVVHTIGEDWCDSGIIDWWDAGIPARLWDSDGWELGWELM